MKFTPRFLLLSAAIILALGLGLWARSVASWRPQKMGEFSASRYHGFIEDAAQGPWVYQSDSLAFNLDTGSRTVIPDADEMFPPRQHCFSSDGRSFARLFQVDSKGLGYPVRIEWRDSASGKLLRRFDKPNGDNTPRDLQFSPDSTKLLISWVNGVEILPLNGSKATFRPFPVPEDGRILSLSPNGELVCVESRQVQPRLTSVLKVYALKTGRLLQTISRGRVRTFTASFSPDNSLLCVTDFDPYKGEYAWIANTKSGAKLWDVNVNPGETDIRFRFAPDSETVLIFDDEGDNKSFIGSKRGVELRDAHTGKLLRTFQVAKQLDKAAFSLDGNFIFALDTKRNLWKIRVR